MNKNSTIKTILLASTFLTSTLTISAFAAAPAKSAAKKKAAAVVAKTNAKPAPAIAAASISAAPATQTSSTTTAEIKPESAKKWSASLTFDYEGSSQKINNNEDADVTGLYVLKGSYKLNQNLSLFARPTLKQNIKTLSASDSNSSFTDLIVGANQSLENVLSIFPKMSLEHRIYLPTSKESQDKNLNVAYKGLYGMPFAITPKLEVSYNFWPAVSSWRDQTKYSVTHFGEISYQLTETLSVAQDLGLSHKFNTLSNLGISRNAESMISTTALAWAPIKNFTFLLQLNDEKDIFGGEFTKNDTSTYELTAIFSI